MQPIQFFAARAEDGASVPGATVDVFVSGTQTRAALFADSLGSVPLANPVMADQNARVFFYSASTRIDIRIHRGAYVGPLMRDVVVTDPDDVLTLTNGLFRTVAQGLAATVSGRTFQVVSAEDEAAYAIYENVGGIAVDTGKRVPARYLLDKVEASAQRNADAAQAYAEGAQAYAGRNFGPLASDPAANPIGERLVAGDRYFNTTNGAERVYTGITWYTPNADGQAIQTALADPNHGAAMVAWGRTALYSSIKTANLALSGLVVNIWEFADLAIGYDPSGFVPSWKWDWTPATVAASAYVKNKGGGTVRYPSGTYPHRLMTKLSTVAWDGDGPNSTFITALPVASVGHFGLIEVEAGAVYASHMSDMHIMGSVTPGFGLDPVNSTQWGMYFKAKWDAAYKHGGLWYSNFTNVRVSNFNKGVWTRGGYTNLHYRRPIQFLKFYQFFVQVPDGGEAIRMTGQHGQIDFIGGSGEGRDAAVAFRCVTLDFDPDPATMADNASGSGESTTDVAGVGHAVLAPINVTFGGKFSFQKAQEGLFGRACRAVVVERCWVEDIGKFVTLASGGQADVTKNHLANAADGTKFGSPGAGYLHKCSSGAGIDFAEDNEIQGIVDNYMDPSTNYNDCLGLNLKGMLSGSPAGKFKAAGFKTLTLNGGVTDLLAHKFVTVNPSVSDPLLKLSNLAATAAPGETVRLRPLIGPITLTNTGNISLNNLTEFTVPQNGVVTLLRIPQVVGAVEWVFVGCTPSLGTAAPADGFYYAAGFERDRSNPAASAPMGWKCVTAGIAGSTAVFKNKPNLAA